MPIFQQQINASYDDAYAQYDAGTGTYGNFPTGAYAQFGHTTYGVAKGQLVHRYQRAFLRFALTGIPKNSTINSAIITLVAYSSRTNDFTALINFTDEDDAADFSSNPYNRSWGGTSVYWNVPDFVAGGSVQTPDLASLIQQFVNRAGYQMGNRIAIVIDYGTAEANEYMQFYQFDGNSSYAAVLTIDYTPPSGGQVYEVYLDAAVQSLGMLVCQTNYNISKDAAVSSQSLHAQETTFNVPKNAVVVSFSTSLIQSIFNLNPEAIAKALAEAAITKEGEIKITKLFLVIGDSAVQIQGD